jgi:phage recombination protein Bet
MNELVKYQTDHGEVSLSPEIIRRYLVPAGTNVTEQEVQLFLQLCKYQGLNPFLREVYLVKYGDFPASIVTGKEVFTKRAMANKDFAGFEAGIVVKSGNKIERREGSMKLPGEELMGGWAKVHVKGHEVPFYDEVSFDEYAAKKRDGTLTGMWQTKPATMIRKVAIVHALREAFPEQFEGLYSQEEISHVDGSRLPESPVQIVEVPGSDGEPLVTAVVDECGTPYADAVEVASAPAPEKKPVPIGDLIIPFGKHKGRTISYIFGSDPGWLEWYAEKGEKQDVKSAITKFLAKHAKQTKDDAEYQQTSITNMPDYGEDIPLPFDMPEERK